MVQITNFETVFSIGFAINVLLYGFGIAVYTENKIQLLKDIYEDTLREKIKITKNDHAFPIGFVISNSYPNSKAAIFFLSFLLSLLCLGMIIWCAFDPSAEIRKSWMVVILIVSFVPVPISSYRLHSWVSKLIIGAIGELENDISSKLEEDNQRIIDARQSDDLTATPKQS